MYLDSEPLSNSPSVTYGEQLTAKSAGVAPPEGETSAGAGTDREQSPS